MAPGRPPLAPPRPAVAGAPPEVAAEVAPEAGAVPVVEEWAVAASVGPWRVSVSLTVATRARGPPSAASRTAAAEGAGPGDPSPSPSSRGAPLLGGATASGTRTPLASSGDKIGHSEGHRHPANIRDIVWYACTLGGGLGKTVVLFTWLLRPLDIRVPCQK